MKLVSDNMLFVTMLTIVWLILLALCAVIGILVVPINSTDHSYFVILLLGGGKVLVSLIFVGLWLVGWYKALNLLLQFEFYQFEINKDKIEH